MQWGYDLGESFLPGQVVLGIFSSPHKHKPVKSLWGAEPSPSLDSKKREITLNISLEVVWFSAIAWPIAHHSSPGVGLSRTSQSMPQISRLGRPLVSFKISRESVALCLQLWMYHVACSMFPLVSRMDNHQFVAIPFTTRTSKIAQMED